MKLILPKLMMLSALAPLMVSANVIVDTKDVDQTQYHADLYECQALSQQVQKEQGNSAGRDMVGSAARGAAIGAAGSAIAGGSGSNGAKVGAGIGLVSGALKHRAEKQHDGEAYELEKDNVMKKCMANRGYTVLN